MSLFDFFRKKAPAPQSERLQTDSKGPDAPDADREEARRNALLALGRQLAGDKPELVREVALALRQPDEYVAQWGDRLDNRGIDGPIPDLPWIALVDALIAEGLADEIDWKADSDTVEYVVANLLRKKRLHPPAKDWFDWEGVERLPTNELLDKLKIKLKPYAVSLACLDIDSDSYVLVVVPADEIEALQALASEAGYRIGDRFA